MADLEETNALLREIRDQLSKSDERYERAVAESKRLYQEYLTKMQRSGAVLVALLGALAAYVDFSR
jgi:hypothetical protein